MERTLEDVVEAIQRARDYGRRCSLLIGSGCSVTAGIPTGSEIVEAIRASSPRVYERARIEKQGAAPTYADCMAQLTWGERRDLLARYVSHARINPAHLAIAAMMKQGYIARVLTTNFDPLVVRACALLNAFPPILDLAEPAVSISPIRIPDNGIYYLHGQSGSHLPSEGPLRQAWGEKAASLLAADKEERPLLVVGYDGENDPLFPYWLACAERFPYGLYWAAYKQEDPAAIVQGSLFQPGKDAFPVRGYDADGFLSELALRLGCLPLECFPPEHSIHPKAMLTEAAATFADCAVLRPDAPAVVSLRSNGVASAPAEATPEPHIISNLHSFIPPSPAESTEARIEIANTLLIQGEYDRLIRLWYDTEEAARDGLAGIVSWAYVGQGNLLCRQAQQNVTQSKAASLLTQAGHKYHFALTIQPQKPEALYNWGCALLLQARLATGAERHRLLSEAEERFIEIETARPGSGLYSLARISVLRGDEEAARRWLTLWRDRKAAPDAEQVRRTPEFEVLRDKDWFRQLLPEEEFSEELATALTEPTASAEDWAESEAGTGRGEGANEPPKEGSEYILEEGPSLEDRRLLLQARLATGAERHRLLSEAEERFIEIETVRPGSGLYSLARISVLRGDEEAARRWLTLWRDRKAAPDAEQVRRTPEFEVLRDKDWFLELMQDSVTEPSAAG